MRRVRAAFWLEVDAREPLSYEKTTHRLHLHCRVIADGLQHGCSLVVVLLHIDCIVIATRAAFERESSHHRLKQLSDTYETSGRYNLDCHAGSV